MHGYVDMAMQHNEAFFQQQFFPPVIPKEVFLCHICKMNELNEWTSIY